MKALLLTMIDNGKILNYYKAKDFAFLNALFSEMTCPSRKNAAIGRQKNYSRLIPQSQKQIMVMLPRTILLTLSNYLVATFMFYNKYTHLCKCASVYNVKITAVKTNLYKAHTRNFFFFIYLSVCSG